MTMKDYDVINLQDTIDEVADSLNYITNTIKRIETLEYLVKALNEIIRLKDGNDVAVYERMLLYYDGELYFERFNLYKEMYA